MPIIEVKCTVENCFFHKIDDICGAEKIEINTTLKGKATEFSADFDARIKKEATHSVDTCCNTFISKKDKKTKA